MRKLIWLAVFMALAAWIVILQRRLQAARMRGDMYRDISTRLDRRVSSVEGLDRRLHRGYR